MKYICSVCGYVFSEEEEGKTFSELPDSWVCPWCKAPKSAFAPEQAKPVKEAVATAGSPVVDPELLELSVSELSTLFSNLARGCEKQFKEEEAALFSEIAQYFDQVAPEPESCDLQELANKILGNLDQDYPNLEAEASACKDRGTLRAYVWGNKVTRMQQALVSQYLEKGEAFLEHTNVWVCTVCGFIYIGDNPPALCPVCKVPDWKFEKMQGGAAV